jgi:outer membrane receptor protein involved in Fe transport
MDPFTARLTISYQHPYNDVVNAFPFSLAGPDRLAGFAHIHAYLNFDLNLTYDLPDDILPGMQVYTTINNLADSDPPYIDNSAGNAGFNQIGRLVTLGFRKKW